MESLVDFALQERYKQVKDLGDRLGDLATLIEWEPFRAIVGDIYTNTTEHGGRSNIDVVLMIKLLVLQSMYGLSDPEPERQANDKISFLMISWVSRENSRSNGGLVFSGTSVQNKEGQSDLD